MPRSMVHSGTTKLLTVDPATKIDFSPDIPELRLIGIKEFLKKKKKKKREEKEKGELTIVSKLKMGQGLNNKNNTTIFPFPMACN